MPKADADDLWMFITKENPYKQWGYFDDHKGLQKGDAPHGSMHIVYANDKVLMSTKEPAQYGSIIVKENFNDAKKLMAITVMYKKQGYNPSKGDWYWVKYTPEGKAGPAGKPAGCIGCHSARADNDFVMIHEFSTY